MLKNKVMESLDADKLQQEIEKEGGGSKIKVSAREMGANLKHVLQEEIEEYNKRDKTRLAEMISILSAHNYYANGFTPVELRTTLEDLGPTYVKIGQIISSRVDLLPEEYCKELEKLRQNVKPLSAEVARAVIEDETGKKIDEIYSEFRDEPLGSASIGQVHYAVLKDGTKVVTKVQRPLIAEMMSKDFVLLKKLVGILDSFSEDDGGDTIDLMQVLVELENVTADELNFLVEAENTKFFKANCIEDENVIDCPTVIDELTTERIYTMTYVDGYSISHKEKMIEAGVDVNEVGSAIVNNFVHQILDVGVFHADPHQGNIMYGNGRPFWIDFGMMGRVSNKDIDNLQSMILSLVGGDADGLVNTLTSMGGMSSDTNREKLIQDAQVFMDRFSSAKSISDLDVSAMFNDIMDLASKHHVKLPGEYTMLARAVLAIEGVIEQLCPELNLMDILTDKLTERLKKNFDLKATLLDAGKGLLGVGKKAADIPGLIADTLAALAKGRIKVGIELTGIEEPLQKIGDFTLNVMLILIACVMFIGACILASVNLEPKIEGGMPLIADILMVFAIALGIYAVKKLANRNKK